MDPFDELFSARAREESGSDTQNRFSYQESWGISKLLRAHASGNDYAFGFELHDDIVELDSSTSPSLIAFIQVKTRENKNWKLKELTKAKGKGKSILIKLLENKSKFPGTGNNFILVSNMQFEFLQRVGEIDAARLNVTNKQQITDAALAAGVSFGVADLPRLFFHVSDLTLDKHEITLTGEVYAFFENLFGDQRAAAHVTAFLRMLRGEVSNRNRVKLSSITTVSEMILRKCLTREQIGACVKRIGDEASFAPRWTTIKTGLMTRGASVSRILSIEPAWEKFNLDRIDAANLVLAALERACAIELSGTTIARESLEEFEAVAASVRDKHKLPGGIGYDTVIAAVIRKYYAQPEA